MRSPALPPSALRARLCCRAFGLLLAAVLLDSPSAAWGAAPAIPGPALALTNVTVIDCAGAPPKPNMTVVIQRGRIVALDKTNRVAVPANAQVINARGQYLIPGLWDMHVHVTHSTFGALFIANGVTGVRHMFSTNPWHSPRRSDRERRAGKRLFPRLVATEKALDGEVPVFNALIRQNILKATTVGEGRARVRQLHREGADFIKVYSSLRREVYFAIVDEARKLGLPVVGHVPHAVSVAEASDAGQKSVEHCSGVALACSRDELKLRKELVTNLFAKKLDALDVASGWRFQVRAYASQDANKADRLFRKFAKNNTWQVPTLVQKRAWGHLHRPAFVNDRRLQQMPALVRWAWQVTPTEDGVRLPNMGLAFTKLDLAEHRLQFRKDLTVLAAMHKAKVRFLAGTDSPAPFCFPGFSLHDEIELLHRAGLSRLEALQTATRNPAELLGQSQDVGTVEKGKIADLVLLDANPLDDIGNTRKIAAVIFDGKLIDRPARQALLASVVAPARK
jgi:imidazolonepropionase-like amidohydrolase